MTVDREDFGRLLRDRGLKVTRQRIQDHEKHHHHHLICMKCGKVISFRDDLLEELEARITADTGFLVVDHEVKLYGYCIECGGDLIEEKRE